MTTEAQIHANRANARKSTGPRTPEGKAVVSQNAVTHGFLARETVIQGEDPGEFEFYRDRMLGELAPAGDAELEMAERAVGLSWRLRRAERLQTEAFDALYEKMATGSPAGGAPPQCVPEPALDAAEGADRLLGRMLVEDFANARVLDRLLVYERRIESSLYRTLRELREQKQVRLAGAPAEAVGRGPARPSRDMNLPYASLAARDLLARGMGFQPMDHRQDADATKSHGQDARDTHGRDAHATEMPGGGITHASAQQSCETKPISARAGRVPGDESSRKESDETNPICAAAGETAVFEAEKRRSVPALGGSVETKPISRGDPSSLPAVRRVA